MNNLELYKRVGIDDRATWEEVWRGYREKETEGKNVYAENRYGQRDGLKRHYKNLMKVHQDFLEWCYFHQYQDGKEHLPCLDRYKEFDEHGNEFWSYYDES